MATDSDAGPSPADTAADTSTAATEIASPAPAETQASAPSGDQAASTPDAPVDDKAGLLAAVLDVVKASPKNPKGEGSTAAPEPAGLGNDPKPGDQAATDPLAADPTEDELKGEKPRTRARMERLLADRNAARSEVDGLKPAAAKWEQMDGYLRKHDLAPADVNLLLGAGAALRRGDFKAFRDGVQPYLDLCNQALGHSLAPDIQAKVDAGELTVEAGRELSMTRFANNRLVGEQKRTTQAAEAARAEEADARITSSVQSAITSWEQGIQGRDPDYARKAATVLRVSQAIMATEGRPRTPEAALVIAKRAYDETNAMFAGIRPAPVAVKPSPNAVNAPSGARAAPRTLMEAAMQGLERGRA